MLVRTVILHEQPVPNGPPSLSTSFFCSRANVAMVMLRDAAVRWFLGVSEPRSWLGLPHTQTQTRAERQFDRLAQPATTGFSRARSLKSHPHRPLSTLLTFPGEPYHTTRREAEGRGASRTDADRFSLPCCVSLCVFVCVSAVSFFALACVLSSLFSSFCGTPIFSLLIRWFVFGVSTFAGFVENTFRVVGLFTPLPVGWYRVGGEG